MSSMDARRVAALHKLQEQGGLATGTALMDFPADGVDALMFLKGDLVMLLEDGPDGTWGFCEGVVGRFKLSHVHFPTLASTSGDSKGAQLAEEAQPEPPKARRALPPSFLSGYSLASHGSLSSLTQESDGSHSPFLAGLEEAAHLRSDGDVEELRDDFDDANGDTLVDADRSQVIVDLPDQEPSEPGTPKRDAPPRGSMSVPLSTESLPRTPGEDSTFEFDSSSSSTTPSDSVGSLPPPDEQDHRHALATALPITVSSPTATGSSAGGSLQDRSFDSQRSAQGANELGDETLTAGLEDVSRRPPAQTLSHSESSTSTSRMALSRPATPDSPRRHRSDPSYQADSDRSPERRHRRSSAPSSPKATRLPPRPAKSPSRKRASSTKSPANSAASSSASSPRAAYANLPPPSSSSSLASLGPPLIKTVRANSPTFSSSMSSSTISSDGRAAEFEVGEIFDAYGRESMYAAPPGWSWQNATEKEKQRMSKPFNGLGMALGDRSESPTTAEPTPSDRVKANSDLKKKRQSMMTFNAAHPAAAPPLPAIPSLSTSTQTSVETSDDSPTTPTAPLVDTRDIKPTFAADVPLPMSPDADPTLSQSSAQASLGATLLGLTSPIASPDEAVDPPGILPSLSPPVASSSWSNPLSLASDLRKRIQKRSENSPTATPTPSFEGGEGDDDSGDEVVLAGELARDASDEADVSLTTSAFSAATSGKPSDEDAWGRDIPSLSTNASRTPPALTIDTGRYQQPTATVKRGVSSTSTATSASSPKEAFYGRSDHELGSSPGPVPISFFVGQQTGGAYNRSAYTSMSPSPPSTPKGLHPAPGEVFSRADNLRTYSPAAPQFPSVGGGSSMAKAPKPAFFASRPRSQSFSGQAVEIGFPVHHDTSSSGPRSFTTISTSPKSTNGINARPSLTSLGIGENVAVPDAPFMRPPLQRRGSDRSPLSAPPTVAPSTRESPRSAAASRFEQLQALPKPFVRGPTDRSVSSRAALPSQEPAPVTSPTTPETKKGIKGFFARSRSKSDARPPPNRAELESLRQPAVPLAASSPSTSPVLSTKPFSRPPLGSSPRPSVASLDNPSSFHPPPPLDQPSSASVSSVDSTLHSPVVRTPMSSNVALPSALLAGKVATSSQAQRSFSQSSGLQQTDQDVAHPLPPPRRPSARSASPASTTSAERTTPKSILKSPKSPPSNATSPVGGDKPLTVPSSQRHFADLMNESASKPEPESSAPAHNARPSSAREESPVVTEPEAALAPAAARMPSASHLSQPRRPLGPPPDVDEYGFHLRPGQRHPARTPGLSPEESQAAEQKLRTILAGPSPAAALKDKKTRKLFRAGLPPDMRGEVWMFFSEANNRRNQGQWDKLLDEAEETDEMKKDVNSAFRDHAHFNEPYSGLRDLHDVIRCFGKLNSRLPYQSTLVPVAGVALLEVSPEESLYLVATLADRLKGYFDKALQIDALVWVYLLEAIDKNLARRLVIDCRVDMTKVLSRWLLPLFVRVLPFATVLRVWDMFFLEGITFLLRIALAIVIASKGRLLDGHRLHSPQLVEHYLLHLPQDELLSADVLLATADGLKVSMKDDDMKKWRKKAVDTLISSRAAQAERERKAARARR